MQQLEESVTRYMRELDRADRDESTVLPERVSHLKEKIAKVKEQMRSLQEIGEQMKASPDGQVSLTDPDARSMATSGRGTGVVGYNVQSVVDTRHHLIVAHEVTNVGHDRSQLANMAVKAKEETGGDHLIALADRGYYDGDEIRNAELAGVATLTEAIDLREHRRGAVRQKGLRLRRTSRRISMPGRTDRYSPVHERRARQDDASLLDVGVSDLSDQAEFTTGDYRRITRWEHEDILDIVQERLDDAPETMLLRRRNVEHVFGTLKSWMGSTHFLTKTLPKVAAEKSLHVLAYNLKRAIKILGAKELMDAMRGVGRGTFFEPTLGSKASPAQRRVPVMAPPGVCTQPRPKGDNRDRRKQSLKMGASCWSN